MLRRMEVNQSESMVRTTRMTVAMLLAITTIGTTLTGAMENGGIPVDVNPIGMALSGFIVTVGGAMEVDHGQEKVSSCPRFFLIVSMQER